jgi:hypothetical protein
MYDEVENAFSLTGSEFSSLYEVTQLTGQVSLRGVVSS